MSNLTLRFEYAILAGEFLATLSRRSVEEFEHLRHRKNNLRQCQLAAMYTLSTYQYVLPALLQEQRVDLC